MYTRISHVTIGSTIGSFRRFARVLHLPIFPSYPLSHSRNLSILHMWSQVARVQAGLRKKKNGEDKEGMPDGKGGWLGERERRTRWGRRRRRVRVPEPRERILLTVRERAPFLPARVGGPANNAGLVFLNPRGGIGASRSVASLPRPCPARPALVRPSKRNRQVTSALATTTTTAVAASGSHVPFSFYFLFIRRAARPGENGLTVPRGCAEGRRRGRRSSEWIIEASGAGRETVNDPALRQDQGKRNARYRCCCWLDNRGSFPQWTLRKSDHRLNRCSPSGIKRKSAYMRRLFNSDYFFCAPTTKINFVHFLITKFSIYLRFYYCMFIRLLIRLCKRYKDLV